MARRKKRGPRFGPGKSVYSAIAIIPPEEIWGPIQAIRSRYDRRYTRWMPHITLIFPFAPPGQIDERIPVIREALQKLSPFDIELREFRYFQHPTGSATIWLAPEPAEPLRELHAALLKVLPEYDDQLRPSGVFVPHLSVGQAPTWTEAERLAREFQAGWNPLRFRVDHVSVLTRGPETPFKEMLRIPLGNAGGNVRDTCEP